MPKIQILVISQRDIERGKDPFPVVTRELPVPSIGEILQIFVTEEDPWGFTGWMTIKIFEVRWFFGAGEEDLLIAVYGEPGVMRKPPEEYNVDKNKIIWKHSN